DMLYSKLKKTKIQINIAGIVIGSAEDTFTFLNECFIKPPDAEKSMDPVCAFKQFKLFFESNERTIPTGSYDFIVYLTSDDMIRVKKDEKGREESYRVEDNTCAWIGLGENHGYLYENYVKEGESAKPIIATIQDEGQLKSFGIVAHEIGHLMSLYHDQSSPLTADGECCGYIMKPTSIHCMQCLSWSPTSEETLRLFF
ncbi:hypothetical protein PV328_012256, partial [Microctonus aethiopoides]